MMVEQRNDGCKKDEEEQEEKEKVAEEEKRQECVGTVASGGGARLPSSNRAKLVGTAAAQAGRGTPDVMSHLRPRVVPIDEAVLIADEAEVERKEEPETKKDRVGPTLEMGGASRRGMVRIQSAGPGDMPRVLFSPHRAQPAAQSLKNGDPPGQNVVNPRHVSCQVPLSPMHSRRQEPQQPQQHRQLQGRSNTTLSYPQQPVTATGRPSSSSKSSPPLVAMFRNRVQPLDDPFGGVPLRFSQQHQADDFHNNGAGGSTRCVSCGLNIAARPGAHCQLADSGHSFAASHFFASSPHSASPDRKEPAPRRYEVRADQPATAQKLSPVAATTTPAAVEDLVDAEIDDEQHKEIDTELA